MRPANEGDVGFIFNSWLKSFRNSEFPNSITNEIYFSEHHKVIERIFKFYDVIIACNDSDPSQIYGFMCAGYTDNVFTLHYVYVKHTFRRMGIAKALATSFNFNPSYASVHTHTCKIAKILAPKYNMMYHPYLAMDPAAYNTNKQEEVYNKKSSKKSTKIQKSVEASK